MSAIVFMPTAVYQWFAGFGSQRQGPGQVSPSPENVTTLRADATDRLTLPDIAADKSHGKLD